MVCLEPQWQKRLISRLVKEGGEEATTAAPPITLALRSSENKAPLVRVSCWAVSFLMLSHPKLDFRPRFYDRCHSLLERPRLFSCHAQVIKTS